MPDNPDAICRTCRGDRRCVSCMGAGEVPAAQTATHRPVLVGCVFCGGTGECPTCAGTGDRPDEAA
jgi:hypothetical protein